jgi:hypothetical protein
MSTAAALSLGAQYAAFAAKHAHLLRTLETVVNVRTCCLQSRLARAECATAAPQSAAWLAPEGEAADFALEAGA